MINTRPLTPLSNNGQISASDIQRMASDGPYPIANRGRGQLISPPNSGDSISAMNGGYAQSPRSAGGPSPPPSVGRSSTATNLYAKSESGRSLRDADVEVTLGEHYIALKRYLSQTSRDGKPNPPPNKARDKLQRLTSVQFLELSTDVFDELLRRQAFSRRPPNAPPNVGPPPFLLPEEGFHPKRNQARQKLSSLGAPRFRDLATDVFCELERRFPRFVAGEIPRMQSPASIRGPQSRSTTPLNGTTAFPPRGPSRIRRPSEASSLRGMGPGQAQNLYSMDESPPVPQPATFNRPVPKQFQSNTIVPNKSTMVEEDDEPEDDGDVYGLNNGRASVKSVPMPQSRVTSEADKRLMESYEEQVRDLRDKLDSMEDTLKRKDDEKNDALESERKRASHIDAEKKQWADIRLNLEDKLAEAQSLNDNMRDELNRIRNEHASETRGLRQQMDEIRVTSARPPRVDDDAELRRENDELRAVLDDQRHTTEEVRREAQESLKEMKLLSEQSSASWTKQTEMEGLIEQLEKDVRDWRNRYARTKTQLRNLRASSLGLTIDQDAGKYVREKGFTEDNGLVKDVHVTKFQIAIDELLQCARGEDPDKVIGAMKLVVVGVRRIIKDIDSSLPVDEDATKERKKLKTKVSSTANQLITNSKTFASSAGIFPVSLVDAAASHLVAAVVELLRTVKIRATPAGELDDDDDGSITPVDSTGFFSPRSTSRTESLQGQGAVKKMVPTPPPFQGLGSRISAGSSAYSPATSPRESMETYGRRSLSRNRNGNGVNGYPNMAAINTIASQGGGYGGRAADSNIEDLKVYLDDQTAILVQTIQNLVGSIRGDADIGQISVQIDAISETVGNVIRRTEASGNGGPMLERLGACRQRLMEASDRGQELAAQGKTQRDREWRMWTQTLPPIAFEVAKQTKELVQRIERLID